MGNTHGPTMQARRPADGLLSLFERAPLDLVGQVLALRPPRRKLDRVLLLPLRPGHRAIGRLDDRVVGRVAHAAILPGKRGHRNHISDFLSRSGDADQGSRPAHFAGLHDNFANLRPKYALHDQR